MSASTGFAQGGLAPDGAHPTLGSQSGIWARLASRPAHLLIAILITALGAAFAYAELLGVPVQGIDDANITHVYARNIASGFGYVYNVGGERVEGSTSAAWTALNALAFLVTSTPFRGLALLDAAITAAGLYSTLRLAAWVARLFGIHMGCATVATTLLLLSSPPYFTWNVWSLMDVTLWSTQVVVLFFLGLRLALAKGAVSRLALGFGALGILVTATRPEGIAWVLGLGLLVAGIRLVLHRDPAGTLRTLAATAAGSLAFGGLTLARIAYFGQPLPNTYYAKVPADLITTLHGGASYLVLAVLQVNHLVFGLAAWFVLALSALAWRGAEAPLRLAFAFYSLAALAGFATIVALTGGDHFSDQRFLQPIWPVAMAGLGVCSAALWQAVRNQGPPRLVLSVTALFGLLLVIVPNAQYWRLNNNKGGGAETLYVEFELAEKGKRYGEQLAALRIQHGAFSVGVIAAGAVALELRGQVYDLLGLNWVEMAHADRRKTGMRNHASFNAEVLLRAMPDLLGIEDPYLGFKLLKDVHLDPRFRAAYVPVIFTLPGQPPLRVVASRQWLIGRDMVGAAIHEWQ